MDNRIAHLVAQAREATSWELTKVGDRDAIRIVHADGSRLSFLTPDEVAALRAAFDAPPDVWTIAGVPPCTWDPLRGWAEGKDEALGITVTIRGTRNELSAMVASRLAAAYRDVITRTDVIREQVAKRVAASANGGWRQHRPHLTIAGVAARIRLTSIHLSTDSEHDPTLWFDDGDLFWGHSIEVFLGPDGNVSDAMIAG